MKAGSIQLRNRKVTSRKWEKRQGKVMSTRKTKGHGLHV